MDLERALHKKWNLIPMAVVQRFILSRMKRCVGAGGYRRSILILSTDVTPVQFDAMFCVMKKVAPKGNDRSTESQQL